MSPGKVRIKTVAAKAELIREMLAGIKQRVESNM